MRISILGIGYVGAVSAGCLAALGHQIIGVDTNPDKTAMLTAGHSPIVEAQIDDLIATAVQRGALSATTDLPQAIAETDLSFIAVGTPSRLDGAVDLRAIDAVTQQIGAALRTKTTPHTIVMRSTVPPGTATSRIIPALEQATGTAHGDGFCYYSNPEFLREGSSVRDFQNPPFTLIGAPPGDDARVLRELYAPIPGDLHVVDYATAEAAKYLSNAFHATKLAFANETGAILAAMGVDARAAFDLFCQDRTLNISRAYLTPGFAFGGSCLPKDVRSFLALADQAQIPAPFLRHILPSNQAIIDTTFAVIARHGRPRIALYGLAFKQGTDDLRESPYVVLAERLLGRGYELAIYDRSVQLARLTGANRAYIEREIPHLDRLLAPNPLDPLNHAGLVVLGHLAPEDRPAVFDAIGDRPILDLAGYPELRRRAGYTGLCW